MTEASDVETFRDSKEDQLNNTKYEVIGGITEGLEHIITDHFDVILANVRGALNNCDLLDVEALVDELDQALYELRYYSNLAVMVQRAEQVTGSHGPELVAGAVNLVQQLEQVIASRMDELKDDVADELKNAPDPGHGDAPHGAYL